jgi:hypothetical protein
MIFVMQVILPGMIKPGKGFNWVSGRWCLYRHGPGIILLFVLLNRQYCLAQSNAEIYAAKLRITRLYQGMV